jgi:hypothetical protein
MGEKLPPSFPFPCKSQKLETHNKKHFEGFHKKRKQPGESLARIYLSKQDKVGGKIKKGKRITSWGIKGLKVVVLCPGYIYTF